MGGLLLLLAVLEHEDLHAAEDGLLAAEEDAVELVVAQDLLADAHEEERGAHDLRLGGVPRVREVREDGGFPRLEQVVERAEHPVLRQWERVVALVVQRQGGEGWETERGSTSDRPRSDPCWRDHLLGLRPQRVSQERCDDVHAALLPDLLRNRPTSRS